MSEVVQYHSLEGVAGGRLDGPIVNSAAAVLNSLRRHRAASAAGDEGAITVWVDDAGKIRCALYRWGATIASADLATKADLRRWLRAWWPAMRDAAHRPEFTS